jgi:hypothetical protein
VDGKGKFMAAADDDGNVVVLDLAAQTVPSPFPFLWMCRIIEGAERGSKVGGVRLGVRLTAMCWVGCGCA